MTDLAARGRKRGFCLVGATQRFAKLDKDVVAELQNKIIGLCNMGLDRKRAAEELGLVDKEEIMSLRDVEPGEFFALGPAFPRGVTKIKINPVETTHHEAGTVFKRRYKPAPSTAIQRILKSLQDIPEEFEEEQSTRKEQNEKIRELQAEVRKAKQSMRVETKLTTDPKAVSRAVEKFKKALLKDIEKASKQFHKMVTEGFSDSHVTDTLKYSEFIPPKITPVHPATPSARIESGNGSSLGKGERAILKFLAISPDRVYTKSQVGALTGYAHGSGSFATYLSRLSVQGLIEKNGYGIKLADGKLDEAQTLLGSEFIEPGHDALVAWLQKLGKGERKIFEVIKDNPDRNFSREELCAETGYEDSGSFATYLSRLNALALIQKNNDKTICLNRELLEV